MRAHDAPLPASHESPALRQAWLSVGVLLVIYILSFVDRMILSLLVEPIERDLGIGDFEMGLLLGPAFGMFYVLCGLAMGSLVDRFSRRRIIGLGMLTWGLATSAGGFVRTFGTLFAARMGLGLGEAVLTPAAHAIIAETFPPRRLSLALGVFSSGVVIGSSIAIALGGLIIHLIGDTPVAVPLAGGLRPWNAVLLLIGIVTLLLVPIVLLLPRQRPPAPRQHAADSQSFWTLLRRDWRIFLLVPIGFGCTNIIVNALFAWTPALLGRSYGWSPGQIGPALAVQHLGCGLIGQIGTALLADRLFARGITDAHTRIQIGSLLISVPLLITGLLAGGAWPLLILSSAFVLMSYPFLGYANAALQLLTPPDLRGRVSATFLAIVTAIGSFVGAPLIGYVSQNLAIGPTPLATALAAVACGAGLLAVSCLVVAGRALRQAHARR